MKDRSIGPAGMSGRIATVELVDSNPNIIYVGAATGGLSLDTTNAENHTTIITIAPTPVKKGVIWAGTDDGNVQLTLDGGKTWTNVVKNIKGIAPNSWCPHIEASKFDSKTAYVVFDDHRRCSWPQGKNGSGIEGIKKDRE